MTEFRAKTKTLSENPMEIRFLRKNRKMLYDRISCQNKKNARKFDGISRFTNKSKIDHFFVPKKVQEAILEAITEAIKEGITKAITEDVI